MQEYEIFVSASYITDGGTKAYNCFKVYVMADSEDEAVKLVKADLWREGYCDFEMDRPIAV